jgi:hypothetical protein
MMHDSQKKTKKKPFQKSDLWKQGEYNIVSLLTQKKTRHILKYYQFRTHLKQEKVLQF